MLIPFGILSAAGASGFTSDYELLETQILATTATSITFASLSTYASTYKHLQIRGVARTNRASTLDDVQLQFNADTGTNYSYHNVQGSGSTVTSAGGASTPSIVLSYTPGASNTANAFSTFNADILDAFSTSKNKTVKSFSGQVDGSWTLVNLWSGAWRNTSAASSIRLFSSNGTSYIAGSRFSLYGIKG